MPKSDFVSDYEFGHRGENRDINYRRPGAPGGVKETAAQFGHRGETRDIN